MPRQYLLPLFRMPTRIFTPGRAGLIFGTAFIVTTFNVMISYSDIPMLSTCDQHYIKNILDGPVAQDNPVLLEWIKQQFVPPSKEEYELEYNLSGLHEEDTLGRGMYSPSQEFILSKIEEVADKWMMNDIKGTFLEAGAYDGEYLSNTLALEKNFGWKGILVEGHPEFFKKLLTKNRKAYAINACLNTKPYPTKETFLSASANADTMHTVNGPKDNITSAHGSLASSGLANDSDLKNKTQISGYIEVQCLPIYSIVLSLGISNIDFLSLDVERAEMGILETIPWDKLTFGMMAIEHLTLEDLREYLRPKGYIHVESLHNDHIFVNKNFGKIIQIDPGSTGKHYEIEKNAANVNDLMKKGVIKIRKNRNKVKKLNKPRKKYLTH